MAKDIKALNKGEFEGYGEEMLNLVERVNSLSGENQQIKDKLTGVETEVKTTSEQLQTTSEKGFFSDLTNAVPDWEVINKDQKWLNWLAEPDPLTGQIRQTLLDDALAARDSNRVATFLRSYKGGGSGPGPSQKPKITREEYNQAIKNATTGRITEKEFEKIADEYQRQLTGA